MRCRFAANLNGHAVEGAGASTPDGSFVMSATKRKHLTSFAPETWAMTS